MGRSVIVIGDLNSDPSHPSWAGDDSIAMLETGGAPTLFRSARHTGPTTSSTATFNAAWKSPDTNDTRLDYILVSGGDMTTSDPLIDTRTFDGHLTFRPLRRHGDGRADKLFWRPNYREGRIQVYLGTGSGFTGGPLMDNTGWSESENTEFHFADLDGSGGADKVYWNPGANSGGSRAYLSRY